jgi:hypothetical protein
VIGIDRAAPCLEKGQDEAQGATQQAALPLVLILEIMACARTPSTIRLQLSRAVRDELLLCSQRLSYCNRRLDAGSLEAAARCMALVHARTGPFRLAIDSGTFLDSSAGGGWRDDSQRKVQQDDDAFALGRAMLREVLLTGHPAVTELDLAFLALHAAEWQALASNHLWPRLRKLTAHPLHVIPVIGSFTGLQELTLRGKYPCNGDIALPPGAAGLKKLQLSVEQLTSLDVRNAPGLRHLEVVCRADPCTAWSVSSCTQMTHLSIRITGGSYRGWVDLVQLKCCVANAAGALVSWCDALL